MSLEKVNEKETQLEKQLTSVILKFVSNNTFKYTTQVSKQNLMKYHLYEVLQELEESYTSLSEQLGYAVMPPSA
jgi:hypothetical protein